MKRYKSTFLLFILILIFVLPGSAAAQTESLPNLDDKIVFAGTFTLDEGETLNGSLIVVGGVISLEEDSRVRGDVVILGGSATIAGEIQNSLIALGGVINVKETAFIKGDLVVPGSVLTREDGSQIGGQIITEGGTVSIDLPDVTRIEVFSTPPAVFNVFGLASSSAFSILWFTFQAFAFSAVAVLMVLFIPKHTNRTREAMMNYPVLSGGLGFLTIISAFPITFLLAITIILSPLSALVIILLLLGFLIGWLTLGVEVGSRVGEALDQSWSMAVQAGLGTFILVLVTFVFSLALWRGIGWLLFITIGSVGLGAVMLTRFGSRTYLSPGDMSPVEAEVETDES